MVIEQTPKYEMSWSNLQKPLPFDSDIATKRTKD